MTVATLRRLPGFAFEARAPVYEDVLPRMDVAVFVGFAASGPVSVPVPIEDVAQFEAVFGADAPLAWDADLGRVRVAQLAPAVRAFFANGGRRCWIVRVARATQPAALPVPGIAVVQGADRFVPLALAARSAGSWSDAVSLSASLTARRLGVLDWRSGAAEFDLVGTTAGAVEAGDLLHVVWPEAFVELYAGVETVTASIAERSDRRRTPLHVRVGDARWFDTVRHPIEHEGTATLRSATVGARFAGAASPPVPDDLVTIALAVAPADAPRAGEVIVATFAQDRLLLVVREIQVTEVHDSSPAFNVQVSGKGLWARRTPYTWTEASPTERPVMTVERLGLDLWARVGTAEVRRIGELGLAPGHPRHIAQLPDDNTVFGAAEWAGAAIWRDAITPRFPAAGLSASQSDGDPTALPLCIPFGVTALPEHYLPALTSEDSPLVRDGLAPFDASLFADPAVAASLSSTLLADAEYVRFFAPVTHALTGLHAALPIEEATLIAVPDAAQPGWAKGTRLLPDVTTFDPKPACRDEGRFAGCDALACAPLLTAGPLADGIVLTWTADDHRGLFQVQRSRTAEWADAAIVFEDHAHTVTLAQPAAGDYFYRVRGIGDRPTEWSNGIASRVSGAGGWRALPRREYRDEALVAVHRLLLRLSAARRDMLAVLSLPEHYREDEAAAHVRLLASPDASPIAVGTSDVLPIGYGETDALGFGALYHGWIHTRDEGGDLRTIGPDGPACGVIARRANERGAWIAPANEPLQGALALERPAAAARWQELQQLRVNVIRQFQHGFVVMSADTLAPDEDLRPISVRRLLILLRRVATRLGATYVFEPNDDAFRRMVQRGFEEMLGGLFQRGAFAGATAATAFQVVTDNALNTPASIDQGRFIVELRVAPSRPLTFLTLRLVQTGTRVTVTGA